MSWLPRLAGWLRLPSIRSRMLVIALVPALVTEFGLVAYFTSQTLDSAERALVARAENAARHLGDALTYALITGNQAITHSLLLAEINNSGLAHVEVIDPGGLRLASQGILPASDYVSARTLVKLPYALPADDVLAPAPIAAGAPLAAVRVSISRAHVRDFTRNTLLHAALLMLAALTLTAAVAWRLSDRLASQLKHIGHVAGKLAAGDLSVRTHLPAHGEVGALATGIDDMADALHVQRNEMEARVFKATADLAAKKDMAERANIAKSRFFAAASHDLRQPLHALALFVATLKARNRQPETQPLIDNIEASSAAMELLLNALLDISRLDAGAIEVRPAHFSLNKLFADLETQFSALATEKQLALRFRAPNVTLYSDPLLIERILANFIANAIRYTDDGGVLVSCRITGNRARLAVYDTGRGIPEDQQESVFQEFVQLNNAARDRNKGLGLGLAIVSRLGRLLGYRVKLRSRPGQGSVFSIEVPLGDASLVKGPAHLPLPGLIPDDALVLMIDDESDILRGMAELFDNWNIDLVTAHNADEAMQWLDSLERPPHVIVSDYRLPESDGLGVIARLREKYGADIPAIIVTGDTAPDTIQRITRAGHPLLHKPLRPAKLRALLTHLIQQTRAARNG